MGAHGQGLPRQLRFWDAAAIYVGIILGSGVFFAPGEVAAAVPGLAAAVGLWVLGGVIAACGAFCYAECGARLPRDGGFFVFYRAAFGDGLAFVAGWAALLVTYPSSMAVVALICGRYLGEAVGWPDHPELPSAGAALALLAAAALNLAGVRESALSQRVLTAAKVGSIVLLCLAALVVGGDTATADVGAGAAANAGAPLDAVGVGLGAVGGAATGAALGSQLEALLMALIAILWTYSGWSDVTLISGEIEDPGRNLGRAVIVGTAVLVGLHALVQVAVSLLLSPEAAATSTRVVSDAVGVAFGGRAGRLVAVLVVVSTFGAVSGNVLVVSRLAYAMAHEGMAPGFLRRVHPRLGTPVLAIAVTLAATLVYVASNDFRSLLGLFTFSVWIFFAVAAWGLLRLRRRRVGEPLVWRAPWGVVPPTVVLVTAVAMTVSLLIDPAQRQLALMGLGLLLAAVPAYLVWRWLRAPRAA